MINGQTYYEILDLPKYGINDQGESVSLEKIQKNKQNFDFMLDKNMGQLSPNLKMLKAAQRQEAYNVLSNNELRKEYDQKLKNGYFDDLSVDVNPIKEEVTPVVPDQPVVEEVTPVVPDQPVVEEVTPVVPDQPVAEEVTPVVPDQPVVKEDIKPGINVQSLEYEVLDETKLAEHAKIRSTNIKRIVGNSLIIAGSTFLFGPIGTIVAAINLKKKGKFKLQKVSSKGKLKQIKTLESKLIETENKNLEKEIDTLLNSSLSDNQSRYKLEIAKKRYENQIKLLEKRIEFKKNEKNKLGGKAYNRLYVLALEMRVAADIKSLEMRQKIAESKLNVLNSYNPNTDKKDRLTKIHEEINTTKQKIMDPTTSSFRKNMNAAKLNRLNAKKQQTINKMSLKKNGISRNQVSLALFNSAKDKVFNLLSRKENPVEETIDLMSSSKLVR